MNTIDPTTLAILIPAVLLGHLALLIASARRNVLLILAGFYMLLSPLSVASALPGVALIKYGRVYLSVLILLLGVVIYRCLRFGRASTLFLLFIALFFLSATWADTLVVRNAFLYKGLYAINAVGGLMIAQTIATRADMLSVARWLIVGALGFLAVSFVEILRNPAIVTSFGRILIWGMNPNAVGQAAAPVIILATFIALYDPSKRWRLASYVTGSLAVVLVIASASRGAAGMAMIGVFILALPYIRRPVLLASMLLAGFIVVSVGISLTESNIVERFGSSSFENRYDKWSIALSHFRESPIIGVGWVTSETSIEGGTANMHSIYLQILAETGVVGAIVFAIILGLIGLRFVRAAFLFRRDPLALDTAHLAGALFIAVLAHGVIEASAVVGTSIVSVLLPISIGLVDRLGMIRDDEAARRAGVVPDSFDEIRYTDTEADLDWHTDVEA